MCRKFCLFLFFILLFPCASFSEQCELRFAAPRQIERGVVAREPLLADFTDDGKLDLVWLRAGSIVFQEGKGDGIFGEKKKIAKAPYSSIRTADFDNDETPDLVVQSSHSLLIFLSDKKGGFIPGATLSYEGRVQNLTTADLNGDGNVDLAFTLLRSEFIFMVFGKGNGTFGQTKTVSSGKITDLASGDINADGLSDLAYATEHHNRIVPLINKGNGEFEQKKEIQLKIYAEDLLFSDVDQDQLFDLVISYYAGFLIYKSAGNGSFVFHQELQNARYDLTATTVDMNRDRKDDLVYISSNRLYVRLNVGNGKFGEARSFGSARSFAVGLLDSDQNVDAVVLDSEVLETLYGTSNAGFEVAEVVGRPHGSRTVVLSDVDRNGTLDLIAGSRNAEVLKNNGKGKFLARISLGTGGSSYELSGFNLNQDGNSDLVAQRSENLGILLSSTNGGYRKPQFTTVRSRNYAPVVSADFNLDGHPDLALPGTGNRLLVLAGNGDGSFQSPQTRDFGSFILALTTADWNRDQIPDLAIASQHEITILIGRGDTTFRKLANLKIEDSRSLAAADLDNDGISDLAAATYSGEFTLYRGIGDGTFVKKETLTSGSGPVAILSVDLNRDGLIDLVVANYYSVNVGVFENRGEFHFQTDFYRVAPWPTDAAAGDLDGDGDVDLAVSSDYVGAASILRNACAD